MTRLFNLIRFSQFSPRVAFKNRLYIERASQHRRVLSNLGLTFRNSKWSDYSLSNISVSFKEYRKHAINAVLSLFAFYLVYLYFTNIVAFNALTSDISSLFWFVRDVVYHWVLFTIWLWFGFLNKVINILYTQVFNTVYTAPEADVKEESGVKLTKDDQNLVFFKWLKHHKFDTQSTPVLEKLFNNSAIKRSWDQLHTLFPVFYKLIDILKAAELTHMGLGLRTASQRLSASRINSTDDMEFAVAYGHGEDSNLVAPVMDFKIRTRETHFAEINRTRSPSLRYMNDRFKYNLAAVTPESGHYANLVNSPIGSYYMSNTKAGDLTNLINSVPELELLRSVPDNQIKAYQQQRILYKNSLLHRKILKQTNAVSNTKRLLSSGFFDKSLVSNNLWAASLLKSRSESIQLDGSTYNFIRSVLKSNYGNMVVTDSRPDAFTPALTNTNTDMLYRSLAHLEHSYIWNLKRFYLFNTTRSNAHVFHSQLNDMVATQLSSALAQNENEQLLFKLSTTYALKSYSLNHAGFLTTPSYAETSNLTNVPGYMIKGLNLEFSDTDMLNTDVVDIITDLTQPSRPNSTKSYYFSLLECTSPSTPTFDITFNPSKPGNSDVLFSSLFALDRSFRLDLDKLLSRFDR